MAEEIPVLEAQSHHNNDAIYCLMYMIEVIFGKVSGGNAVHSNTHSILSRGQAVKAIWEGGR